MNSKQGKGMVWVGPMATSKLLGLPIPTSKKNATDGLLLLDRHILGGGGTMIS